MAGTYPTLLNCICLIIFQNSNYWPWRDFFMGKSCQVNTMKVKIFQNTHVIVFLFAVYNNIFFMKNQWTCRNCTRLDISLPSNTCWCYMYSYMLINFLQWYSFGIYVGSGSIHRTAKMLTGYHKSDGTLRTANLFVVATGVGLHYLYRHVLCTINLARIKTIAYTIWLLLAFIAISAIQKRW